MPSRSFRVSEKFLKQLEMIQNYYKNELGLDMTQKELLDEMIELYHCRIMLKSIEELDEVEEKIKDTIIQTIISFIENYDYFVKELETDDYFYGLEDSKDE